MSTENRCACKRGFFTLRDCGNAGVSVCSICARPVCAEHTAQRVDAQVCVECAARQEEETVTTVAEPPGSVQRRYRMRERMYGWYDPVYWGSPYGYHEDWYGDRYLHDDDWDEDAGSFGDS